MKPHKMQNRSNVFLINEFRKKYGFSQAEMAGLLGTTRGQHSHTAISGRSIPVEAERKFLALTEGIQSEVEEPGDGNFAKEEREKRDLFLWRSENDLIAMQHKAALLQDELPRLEKREKELLLVLKNWNELSERGKSLLATRYTPDTIQRKNLAKLAKCDIGVQLGKQAEISVLNAGVKALTQFLANYKSSQAQEVNSSPEISA